MDNFDKLMVLAEVYVGPVIDELYRRLLESDYAQDDRQSIAVRGSDEENRSWYDDGVRKNLQQKCQEDAEEEFFMYARYTENKPDQK